MTYHVGQSKGKSILLLTRISSVCLTENTNTPLINSSLKGGKTFRPLDPSVMVAVHTVERQEQKYVLCKRQREQQILQ